MFSYVKHNTSHFTTRRLCKYLALYAALTAVSLLAAILVYTRLSKEAAFGLVLFVAWALATHAYLWEGCRRPRRYKALAVRFWRESAMRESGICPVHGKSFVVPKRRQRCWDLPACGYERAPFCTKCDEFLTPQLTYNSLRQLAGENSII